jgi:hypothetical protein
MKISGEQEYRMRWIMFWVFITAFALILIFTISSVFFGYGQPTSEERRLLFKTFIVEVGIAIAALFYSLFGIKRGTEKASLKTSNIESEHSILPQSYSFSTIIGEILDTVNRIEADNGSLVRWHVSRGDGPRLFDGIYSSLLYASSAAVTGSVHARFYGNLMEWDSQKKQLRVRFFSGPYNDEIITRNFPVEGKGQGVASEVFKSGIIQIRNRMESELKEKGEARLNAMVCVPIPDLEPKENTKQIVILNIDAGIIDVFPSPGNWQSSEMRNRVEDLARLISRVNKLYRRHVENV